VSYTEGEGCATTTTTTTTTIPATTTTAPALQSGAAIKFAG